MSNQKPSTPKSNKVSTKKRFPYALTFTVKVTVSAANAEDAKEMAKYIDDCLKREARVPNSEGVSVTTDSIEFKA